MSKSFEVGNYVNVNGEGDDIFIVDEISKDRAFLVRKDNCNDHGWESFYKMTHFQPTEREQFMEWLNGRISMETKLAEKENAFVGTHRAKLAVLNEVKEKFNAY